MENILLIEDNLADIELITSYLDLGSFSYRLFKVSSLQDGLEIIRYNHIDIVLLDLALDDTKGFNTLRALFEDVRNIPVIVLTGNSNELLGMQLIRAGAQDFLIKGEFESKQLLRAIRYAMRRHKSQEEIQSDNWNLRHQQRRQQQLYKLAVLGEWELDVLDNSMKWSDEVYEMLGYPAKSFTPKLSDFLSTVSIEERERTREAMEVGIKNGKLFDIQYQAVINNRFVKYFQLWGQIISEESSGKILLIGMLQDISALKNKLNPLNGKTTSHPSLNPEPSLFSVKPLTQLWQYFEILKGVKTIPPPEVIEKSGFALQQLTNLFYEQLNANVLANMPYLQAKQDLFACTDWKNTVESLLVCQSTYNDLKWKTKWKDFLPTECCGDAQLLALLVYNLINVVRSHGQEKGIMQLHFDAKNTGDLVFEFSITLVAPESPLALTKRKELGEKIRTFLPTDHYYQVEDPLRRSIYGLSKILNTLQGYMHINKRQDIELHIPLEKTADKTVEGAAKKLQATNMLVIEPQTIVQIAIRRMLQAHFSALQLDFVTDANQGIQNHLKKEYDIILIDLHLADTNPLELIKKLTNIKSSSILTLAAETEESDRLSLHELGVAIHLKKPLYREQLISAVSAILKNEEAPSDLLK